MATAASLLGSDHECSVQGSGDHSNTSTCTQQAYLTSSLPACIIFDLFSQSLVPPSRLHGRAVSESCCLLLLTWARPEPRLQIRAGRIRIKLTTANAIRTTNIVCRDFEYAVITVRG